MRTGVEIERLPYLQKRLRTLDFIARPARTFLRDWAEEVQKEIGKRVPVFTGETKDSFVIEIGPGAFPKTASVYSDDPRARWLQFGTGELSEDPQSAHQAYFPPVEGVRDWADSKGLDPFTVAVGIFRRGGTPPTHFASDAAEAVNDRLGDRIGRFGRLIEHEAAAG